MVLLLLIVWPLLELFVIVEVALRIGVLWTLVLLIGSFLLGAWAIRRQGALALRRLGDAVAAGRSPGPEALDGALVLLSGALLIVPGFISSLVGVLLLVPVCRALAGRGVVLGLRRHAFAHVVRVGATRFGGQPYDVESTAVDADQRRLTR